MKYFLVVLLYIYSSKTRVVDGHCGWNAYNDTIHIKEKNANGAPNGEGNIQRITTSAGWTQGVFFDDKDKKLIYVDGTIPKVHMWSYSDGSTQHVYLKELEGKSLAFAYPIAQEENKYFVGVGNCIRELDVLDKSGNYNLSEPLLEIPEKGYKIIKAHTDKNGILFMAIAFKYEVAKKNAKIYKISNKKAELVWETDSICDFAWSQNYSSMYVVTDHHRTVSKIKYNLQDATVDDSNLKYVTGFEHHMCRTCRITGIEVDSTDNMWIIIDNAGILVKLDQKGKIKQKIKMNLDMIDSITFGGYQDKNLLIGSKKVHHHPEFSAGSIYLVSGMGVKGIPDVRVSRENRQ